ncbi:DUF4832 domain-containing protein [Paenibacillus sacheonensis]|uniref:DUF4832 domain-containing protein n=1 Tax=Paenibacillus sacheonensis TaxID=742054 RepID=A0A7X4YT11_9BACL|nr:DUF4832 domain-containing protein [Paenibacillus sacheonensis]MBM7567701.1 hypothetical protein [Paenibacillus sacheonensis]NBC72023.1 DUF4832 domain-containing protein [Paenibacillus sacheonensis]
MRKKRIITLISFIFCAALLSFVTWKQLFASTAPPRVSFVPVETTTQLLNNPYMGFVADARYDDAKQPLRLAHVNLRWSELEPTKGNYAFDEVERAFNLALWKQRDVKLILRVVLDYPQEEEHKDIPQWLYEEIGKKGTVYDNPYGKGFSPDYSNPLLIQYHKQLIQKIAERYNDDPSIAFVEIGSVGHWGEWHTYDGDVKKLVIPFPKHAITDQYVQPYIDYFTNKPLMMRRPHAIALAHGMGLFNDAFGEPNSTINGFLDWYSNGYTNWLTQEAEPAMPDFWTKAPSGGEFSSGSTLLSDANIEEALREAKLTHVSWMGPYAPTSEPVNGPMQSNIDRFLTTIGYRFVIAEESHEEELNAGDTLHVKLKVNNRGVAPFYFNWPLELGLTDEAGTLLTTISTKVDIRSWLPGYSEASAELPIPSDLMEGNYRITAAILNPGTGLPGIQLPIDGKRDDGRYTLGSLMVMNSNTTGNPK